MKGLRIIAVVLMFVASWAAIVLYISYLGEYREERSHDVLCRRVIINVADSAERAFLSTNVVSTLLSDHGFNPRGMERDRVDIYAIENFLRSVLYVKDVDVYMSMLGDLHIDLSQRRPIARFISDGGYNFYLSDDNHILPISSDYVEYLPIVTGSIDLPFAPDYIGPFELGGGDGGEQSKKDEKKDGKNYLFLSKLINFVGYIGEDEFWGPQTVQISVVSDPKGVPNIEIVPRVGDHILLLGEIDDYQEKLDKMHNCYLYGMDTTMWSKFKYLDIQYRGQIIGLENRKR